MIYQQIFDSAQNNGLLTSVPVVANKSAPESVCTANRGLTATPIREVPMATFSLTALNLSAQDTPTDPLVLQARFVNEAAALDRALAMRKALRPQRSDSATRGWRTRNGL